MQGIVIVVSLCIGVAFLIVFVTHLLRHRRVVRRESREKLTGGDLQAISKKALPIESGNFHQRYLAEKLKDPAFKDAYERVQKELDASKEH